VLLQPRPAPAAQDHYRRSRRLRFQSSARDPLEHLSGHVKVRVE
jgi:hypothetical protein